jgi:hypothetical protein
MMTSKSEDCDRGSHGRHDSRDSGVSSGSSQVQCDRIGRNFAIWEKIKYSFVFE